MTRPRAYERDLALPAAAGDPDLCPPTLEELGSRAVANLLEPGSPNVVDVELELARWKPHVAMTALYRIVFDDGVERLVIHKRYRGDKAEHVAHHHHAGRRVLEQTDRLRPFAACPEEGWCLWTFPADRVLRGIARVLDARRTARFLEDAATFAPLHIRRRRTSFEIVRYKPERRAVLRADLRLRAPDGTPVERRAGVRVLPVARCADVVRRRHALEGRCRLRAPRLLAHDPCGVLFEEWLSVRVPAPDDFAHAGEAGAATARLHAAPLAEDVRERAPTDTRSLGALFEVARELQDAASTWFATAPTPASSAPVWTHGDLHPDNVALDPETGAGVLLDLDEVAPGQAATDLATWTADALSDDPAQPLDDVLGPLLEGYRSAGGPRVRHDELLGELAQQLVLRAAASVRRLEAGAVDRARARLERARELRRESERSTW